MKISIITVVYNNQAFIADCIRSVQDQTYPQVEHIVIDGGSTDGTQKEIETFKDGLAYYKSEKDEGLYDGLNKGIRQATGDIIGILHSDDLFYDPDTLQKIIKKFQDTNADIVYAKGQYVEKINSQIVKRIYTARQFRKYYIPFGWIPLHTTIYVRKEVFDKYGLYKTSYRIASDYDISLRWFVNAAIKKVYLNEWVVKMRLGGKSTTASLQKKKSAEDLEIIQNYGLYGYFTLICKISRKIPQYILPVFIKY